MKKTTKLFIAMMAASLFCSAAGFAQAPASTMNCLENSSQTGSFSCDKDFGSAVSFADGDQKPSTVLKKKKRKSKKDNTGKKPPKDKKGKGGKPKKDNLRKKK